MPAGFELCCLTLMRDDELVRTIGQRASAHARSRLSASAMARAYRHLLR